MQVDSIRDIPYAKFAVRIYAGFLTEGSFCINDFDVIDVLRCPNCDALFERGRFFTLKGVPSKL
jgi:hypothetical protein